MPNRKKYCIVSTTQSTLLKRNISNIVVAPGQVDTTGRAPVAVVANCEVGVKDAQLAIAALAAALYSPRLAQKQAVRLSRGHSHNGVAAERIDPLRLRYGPADLCLAQPELAVPGGGSRGENEDTEIWG